METALYQNSNGVTGAVSEISFGSELIFPPRRLALPAPDPLKSLHRQCSSARCMGGFWDDEPFAWRAETRGIEYAIDDTHPLSFAHLQTVGVVTVRYPESLQRIRENCGWSDEAESHFFFTNYASFEAAWRCARLLQHTHPGRIAQLNFWDLKLVPQIVMSPFHKYVIV
jgi:hypothetical protein